MKIDKQELIDLLAEKTGMKRTEIESQLSELVDRVLSAAKKGKALEIKGFGLFYFDDDDNLKFDPSDDFSTEINFKYAGMKPVELRGPRESSKETEEDDDEDDDDIFGIELPGEEESEEPEAPEPKKTEPEEDDEEVLEDPFASLLQGAASEMQEKKEEEVRKAGTPPKGSEEKKEEPAEKQPAMGIDVSSTKSSKKKPSKKQEPPKKKKADEKKKDKKKKKATSKTDQKKKDPVLAIITAVLVVVVVVGGYFVYDEFSEAPPEAEPQTQVQEQAPPDVAEEDVTDPEPEAEDAVQPEETETAEPDQPEYGLEGEIVESANDGFTIVLHSMSSEQSANSAADNLKEAGYRAMVTQREIDGNTVYRVGVGQFPSISEAQEAAKELPSPYNEENFIQRIRN